jgi:predicted Zn-dependent peptidase
MCSRAQKVKDMIQIETLTNGLTVIVEEMPHVESVAYDLMIPGGVILDNERRIGASLVLAELTSRGAGGLRAEELSNAFDICGIRHGESAGHDRYIYSGTLLSSHLEEALRLVALMVTKPNFPENELEGIKKLLIQDIAALEDNPTRKAIHELSARYYPQPYDRSSLGTLEGIEAASISDLRSEWRSLFRPEGAVLSIAGKVSAATVHKLVEQTFGDWHGKAAKIPALGKLPRHQNIHIESESAQLQIALAYPSAPFGHPLYYASKVCASILSGGMFGRLFIEVREKRGLCYSVFARHSATKYYGTMLVYAGTTPERAHETLQVLTAELQKVIGSVEREELSRAKANLKASLVIGEESSGARAGSNASDWWLDKRVRTLDEIKAGIDTVDSALVDRCMKEFSSRSYMLLTLGSKRLEVQVPENFMQG